MTDRKKDIILEIKNLRLDFGGSKEVLHDVNFVLKRNSITGMAGRSGSGKSLTALTILGLQNSEKCNYSGNILLHINGESIDLLGFSEKEYEKIRGSKISMVFQDIYSSFDPRLKCGVQLIEVLKTHTGKSNKECVLEAKEHFRKFGLNTRIFDSYPHQVSGGELQRVAFAIALASSPDLLIADEPVTNLDAISKKEILDLIKNINDKNNLSILYISHDIASIQYLTDEIVLMDSGETSIVKADKILDKQLNMRFSVKEDIADTKPVLQLKDIRKKYKRNSIFDIFSSSGELVALKNISFSLNKGEILGIVGESGSGKSTLARIIMGLEKAEKGQYIFEEKDYISANKKDIEYLRKNIQMVYQNPANSLNPLLSNKILIKEPFEVLGLRFDENEMLTRIENTLSKLNLNMDILNRYPQQISGGEAQRLAIARVLLLEPKVIIFDEAVSSLDNQNQYDLLNNLLDLQKERILSYIYITHDLVLARSFCQKLIIMKDGEIVESGLTVDIFKNPKAEYTKKLLNAVF